MNDKYTVRPMIKDDIPEAFALVREFHATILGKLGLHYDETELQKAYEAYAATSLVLVVENKVVGVLAGFVTKHVVGVEPIYQEVAWYVAEEHRRYGVALLDGIEDWCRSRGIRRIIMVSLGERDKVFQRFYTRRGYKMLETEYIKNLEV